MGELNDLDAKRISQICGICSPLIVRRLPRKGSHGQGQNKKEAIEGASKMPFRRRVFNGFQLRKTCSSKQLLTNNFHAGPIHKPSLFNCNECALTNEREDGGCDIAKSTSTIDELFKERGSSENDEQIVAYCLQVLILSGHNLAIRDTSGTSDPYVRVMFSNKTIYKSATVFRNLNPSWNEKFCFMIEKIWPDTELTFKVLDYDRFMRDDFMGAASIKLDSLRHFQTETEMLELQDPRGEYSEQPLGSLKVLLTLLPITETKKQRFIEKSSRGIISEKIECIKQNIVPRAYTTDSASLKQKRTEQDVDLTKAKLIGQNFDVWHSFNGEITEVGYILVTVHRAQNLPPADLNGRSDPFCVLELVNQREQTHTEYKTLNPVWNRQFILWLKDIYEVLEFTVYDEDPNRSEFLGKLAIPLLNVRNGETRWYALKDQKLQSLLPNKGRVLLTMSLEFNYVKAALRTFKPREAKLVKPKPRFKRQHFISNMNQVGDLVAKVVQAKHFVKSCFEWESYPRTICAFSTFCLVTYYVELWHLPLTILAFFVRSSVAHFEHLAKARHMSVKSISSTDSSESSKNLQAHEQGGSPEDDWEGIWEDLSDQQQKGTSSSTKINNEQQNEKEKSLSWRDKFSVIQDTLVVIQTKTDFLLALVERIHNLFNFTVPMLSLTAIVTLLLATVLFYFVPFRWVVMAWGVHKFTKRLRKRRRKIGDNNELLDLLSRVPSNSELESFRTHSTHVPST